METSEKDVKEQSEENSSESSTENKDGVSFANRVAAFYRKYSQIMEKLDVLDSRLQQKEAYPAPEVEAQKEDAQELKKKKISELVEDPDGYISKKIEEHSFKKELPEAVSWLHSQSDYSDGDVPKIERIIRDYGLSGSPLARAKSAFKILKSERIEQRFLADELSKSRTDSIKKEMPEGAGRESPKEKSKPKRADIIKLLANASSPYDQAKYVDMLEDVRD